MNAFSILFSKCPFSMIAFCIFIFLNPVFGKVIINGDREDNPFYKSCVSRGLNHPLGSVQFFSKEFKNSFYESLHGYCLCKGEIDSNERRKSINDSNGQKLNYFFTGRSRYFFDVDVCLHENVFLTQQNIFFDMIFYDNIVPILENHLKEYQPQGLNVVLGREVAQERMRCIRSEMLKTCKKISSLYFIYKCIKKKLKDYEFRTEIGDRCRTNEAFKQQKI